MFANSLSVDQQAPQDFVQTRGQSVANKSRQGSLSEKIAQVCKTLKPYQSIEYDPVTGVLALITELMIPSTASEQVFQILSSRREDEKVTVKRFADNYKISIIKRLKV